MFEVAELGRKVAKKDFKEREPELHTQLLTIQRVLRESEISVIIIVSGVEGAGKGEVVNRLNAWLDSRGMQTFAFWDETDEERERPRFWRFWRTLPPRGTIGILFGSWYTQPIINRAFGNIDEAEFDRNLARIAEFEQMLNDDGTLIVKFWFHLSAEAQQQRLKEDRKGKRAGKLSPLAKKYAKRHNAFSSVSERAIRVTDTGPCPWYIVEAGDRNYRDLTVGATLLNALQQRLAAQAAKAETPLVTDALSPDTPEASITVLDHVDLSSTLTSKQYNRELLACQQRLNKLAWKARKKKRFTIAVFEGWDAAGKGGAIRRVTASMDARLYRVISVAAPTDEERAHHYLWRFWRQVPRAGSVTIYDRSWYGRVLVERVEAFAQQHEWKRAYQEINDFEEQLCDHGVVLMKFWVHLSPEEQLRRFKERETTPWKGHKITDEDWRNREKWEDYKTAVNDMVKRTSTEYAPWTLIAGDDKRFARVEVLKTFCDRLEQSL